MSEMLGLPWQIQVVIVGGYLGYVVAYTGWRTAHKSADSLAIVLCFGGISLLTLDSLEQLTPQKLEVGNYDFSYIRGFIVAGVAIGSAVFAAVIWRRFLRDWAKEKIHKLSSSEDDGLFFGWETLIQHPQLEYNQINVLLKDGRVLESYPLSRFNDWPNGCCVLGGDGSVALYVTHIEGADGNRRETKNLFCDEEGARITYVPADQIAEVDLRRKPTKQSK